MTDEIEAAIKAELVKIPHASLVACDSKGKWSYATVWRVAARAGIKLTAGRRTVGRPLPPKKGATIEQAVAAHPEATQLELAIYWFDFRKTALVLAGSQSRERVSAESAAARKKHGREIDNRR